ncbi:MAG TPA: adenylate kinase [Mycobacteriales bacterium]|nr:adenylate kinase [Mycobacteriales bacterium]
MRILLVGAPGSGKGTQAELLSSALGLEHISSGDLLRGHVARETAIGRSVQEFVRRGDLVPDSIVMDMLRKPVVEAADSGGYILDGFPRTVQQAQAAYDTARTLGVQVQVAVHLDVPEEELVRRLLARGRGADDTEDVIRHRQRVYQEQTTPMLGYYSDREELITVDGTRSPEQVHATILEQLEKVRPRLEGTEA